MLCALLLLPRTSSSSVVRRLRGLSTTLQVRSSLFLRRCSVCAVFAGSNSWRDDEASGRWASSVNNTCWTNKKLYMFAVCGLFLLVVGDEDNHEEEDLQLVAASRDCDPCGVSLLIEAGERRLLAWIRRCTTGRAKADRVILHAGSSNCRSLLNCELSPCIVYSQCTIQTLCLLFVFVQKVGEWLSPVTRTSPEFFCLTSLHCMDSLCVL